jgi:hypothetical protein
MVDVNELNSAYVAMDSWYNLKITSPGWTTPFPFLTADLERLKLRWKRIKLPPLHLYPL